jgi:hypothetical protein
LCSRISRWNGKFRAARGRVSEMALQQSRDKRAIGLRYPRPNAVCRDDVEFRQIAALEQPGKGRLQRAHAGPGAAREVPGRRQVQRIDIAAPVLAGTGGRQHVEGGARAKAEIEVAQLASGRDRAAGEQPQQRRRLLGSIARLERDISDVAVDLHPRRGS